MIEGLFFAFYSSIGGGTFGNMLFQWEQAGVFSYVLPFLIIFALVFGILSTMSLFGDNRAINVILALSTALLALQFNFVSIFFSEIFPRMGMALGAILVVLVLLGLFIPKGEDGGLHKNFKYIMLALVGITVIWVLISSWSSFGWYSGFGWWYGIRYYVPQIIVGALFVGFVAWAIIGGGKKADKDKKKK